MSTNWSLPVNQDDPLKWPQLKRRLAAEWWIFGALLTATVWAMLAWQVGTRTDNLLYDTWTRFDPTHTRTDVVLVEIDNRSLHALGAWPWPRALQARLLTAVTRARPQSVAVNLLLPAIGQSHDDEALVAAIAQSKVPVYLAMALEKPGRESLADPLAALLPAPALRQVAAGIGHTNLVVDPDGFVRRTYLSLPAGGTTWPHLMQTVATGTSDRDGTTRTATPAADLRFTPTLIAFTPHGRFTRVSAADLIQNDRHDAAIAGRHVVVGVTATGIDTSFPTPLAASDGLLSGSETQAYLLNALLDGRDRTQAAPLLLAIISVLPTWLIMIQIRTASPGGAAVSTAATLIFYLALGFYAFTQLDIWFPQTVGLCSVLLVYPLWAWRRLAIIVAYMDKELVRFAAAPQNAKEAEGARFADPVIDRIGHLARAIDHTRRLHQFAADAIQCLPSPTLVVSTQGTVLLANTAARELCQALGVVQLQDAPLDAVLQHFRLTRDGIAVPDWAGIRHNHMHGKIEVSNVRGGQFELVVGALRDHSAALSAWIVQLNDLTIIRSAIRQREEVLQLLTHDMRSPLVSILALVDQHDARHETSGASIRKLAMRVLTLADEFVLLAKARTARYSLEPASVRLLIMDAIEELRPQATARNMEIRLDGERDPRLIMGDHSLLVRCFANVVGNAIKHAHPGTVVTCSIRNVTLAQNAAIQIEVRDQGPGIAPDFLPRIFETYQQAPGSTVRKGTGREGFGLGLTFVELVVRGHGGTIECGSEPGTGTMFLLTFPCMNEPPAPDVSADS